MSEKETLEKDKHSELENIKIRIGELEKSAKKMVEKAQKVANQELVVLEEKWKSAKKSLDEFASDNVEVWDKILDRSEKTKEELSLHFKKVIHFFKKEGISVQDDRWEFYQDHAEQWRWRLIDPDDRLVGSSHKGYPSQAECIANAQRHGYEGEGN